MEAMTNRDYVQMRTTKQLHEELKQLNDSIDVFECFNTRDLTLREEIEAELERRVRSCGA